MGNQARVTSTDALELFRASLVNFLARARRSADDMGDDVRRTRQWLQHEQRMVWEGEMRRRRKLLQRAQQELDSARLGSNQEMAMLARQSAVNKARRSLAEAEEKLRLIKKWNQNFDRVASPVVKRLESLRHLLDHDIPKAIAYLANVQRVLDAYVEPPPTLTAPPPAATPPAEMGSQP